MFSCVNVSTTDKVIVPEVTSLIVTTLLFDAVPDIVHFCRGTQPSVKKLPVALVIVAGAALLYVNVPDVYGTDTPPSS